MRRAPALVPLVVGFVLLLALVVALGTSAARRLDAVSGEVLDLQRRRGEQAGYLGDLHAALVKLDDEARARAGAESRGGIVPPFALGLRSARAQLVSVAARFRSLTFIAPDEREAFARDLDAYVEVTESIERYNLEGFERFRSLESRLEILRAAAAKAQGEVAERANELQRSARDAIRRTMLLALAAGLAVAVGTIWEVQRRFRQTSLSLEETRREREFSAQVFEAMPAAVATLGAGDQLMIANEPFLHIFPRATLGARLTEESPTPEALRMMRSVTAERAREASYRGRWRLLVEANGTAATGDEFGDDSNGARTFDAYAAPVMLGDEAGSIITLVDVTEAAAAEERLRHQTSLAAVGQAAAQVAHEIRNPLNSIRLGVLHLRDITAPEGEARQIIDIIERGIAHLNKLTVDVTQFARERDLELASTDLRSLLDESLELVRDRIVDKRIRVERRYPPEPLRGKVDADRLRQVFVNLIANAVEASSESAPLAITLETRPREKRNAKQADDTRANVARITIADAGGGMTEETRARLFEAFYTTKKQGTGLGLAISKKIIEQHDGTIEVASELGKGTAFTIELPL